MKCPECKRAKVKTRTETRRPPGANVPVTVVDATVSFCPECGWSGLAIPKHTDFVRSLAEAVITKRSRLTPDDVRYLRQHLGWSGAVLAERLGVTRETVSRWETGAVAPAMTADRLLRAVIAANTTGMNVRASLLVEIGTEETGRLPRVRYDGTTWVVERAARGAPATRLERRAAG